MPPLLMPPLLTHSRLHLHSTAHATTAHSPTHSCPLSFCLISFWPAAAACGVVVCQVAGRPPSPSFVPGSCQAGRWDLFFSRGGTGGERREPSSHRNSCPSGAMGTALPIAPTAAKPKTKPALHREANGLALHLPGTFAFALRRGLDLHQESGGFFLTPAGWPDIRTRGDELSFGRAL